MIALSALGVIAGVVLISVGAFKGYGPMLMAPLAGILICLTSGISLVGGMVNGFQAGVAGMVQALFLIYFGCLVFGNVMLANKGAYSIAYWMRDHFNPALAPMICCLITGVLTMGGINIGAMVVVIPIGLLLFSEAGYSKDLLCGSIMAGQWTFSLSMTWAPSANNGLLVANLGDLGVTSGSGKWPGLAAGMFMLIGCCVYLQWQAGHWKKRGRVFDAWDELPQQTEDRSGYPSVMLSLIPLIAVLITFNVLRWNLALSLLFGALLGVLIGWRQQTPAEWLGTLKTAAEQEIPMICNVAVMGGIGGVVKLTPFFTWVLDWIQRSDMNPYLLCAISGTLLAAVIGSASSAIGIALPLLRPILEMYVGQGYDIGNMARIIALSSIGPDSLPHNGSIIAQMQLVKTDHRHSYFPIFVCTVIITTIAAYFVALPMMFAGLK